jgi:hypothetical protein
MEQGVNAYAYASIPGPIVYAWKMMRSSVITEELGLATNILGMEWRACTESERGVVEVNREVAGP